MNKRPQYRQLWLFTALMALATCLLQPAFGQEAAPTVELTSMVKDACPACVRTAKKVYRVVIVRYRVDSILFFVLIGAILIFEFLLPARPRQKLFSVSFCHDILWFIVNALAMAFLVVLYMRLLRELYESHLSFLRFDSLKDLHPAIQIGLAILVSDFIRWFHHLLRHKITPFWFFHAVHHSQRQLNLFSDFRVHPVERLIEHTVRFIPFLTIETPLVPQAMVAWYLFGGWYARFYHGNIRTNLGILRFVMVTPQSHRIHHSIEPRHKDKNFGAIFSIWDHLFGTQYRNYDEYPETGIQDQSFPHEVSMRPLRAGFTLLQQLLYPFVLLGRYIRDMLLSPFRVRAGDP